MRTIKREPRRNQTWGMKIRRCLDRLEPLVRLERIMKEVRTLHDLYDLRSERRSVVCPSSPCWYKPRPAAFILNLSGEIILRLIKGGMFVYEKKSNAKITSGENREGVQHEQ